MVETIRLTFTSMDWVHNMQVTKELFKLKSNKCFIDEIYVIEDVTDARGNKMSIGVMLGEPQTIFISK